MVRMIDANRLKDAIYTDFWEHFTQCHDSDQTALIDMVMDDIDEMPTLAPPNEWISVEERLPGGSGDYICVLQDKNGCEWVIPAEWSREMKTWFGRFGEIRNKVIHWMELPAPPESRPTEGETDE